MLEKHKFLNVMDARLQDMIKMFKEEELLSPDTSSSRIRAMANRYGKKNNGGHVKPLFKEVQSNKSKCLERICLVNLFVTINYYNHVYF